MVYADANATYPVDYAHYEAVVELLKKVDGNPSSIHAQGREAKVALEDARTAVARMFGAQSSEIIFTSGATEANNMVIQGVANRTEHKPAHVVVSRGEHSSVLETVQGLLERGVIELSYIDLEQDGKISASHLRDVLRPDTRLVALIHGNNETGAVSPVVEMAAMVRQIAPLCHVHVDSVQALAKYDLSYVSSSPITSASVSAHKVGGFKGIGALYLKSGNMLARHSFGGGQERARRPGTENMPGILSFGMRAKALPSEREGRVGAMLAARAYWLDVLNGIPGAVIHGAASLDQEHQLPNTVNFHVNGVKGDDILLNFDLSGISASSGSACSSGSARPSHVLLAMGLSEEVALNSVRVSFTHEFNDAGLKKMAEVLKMVQQRAQKKGAGLGR